MAVEPVSVQKWQSEPVNWRDTKGLKFWNLLHLIYSPSHQEKNLFFHHWLSFWFPLDWNPKVDYLWECWILENLQTHQWVKKVRENFLFIPHLKKKKKKSEIFQWATHVLLMYKERYMKSEKKKLVIIISPSLSVEAEIHHQCVIIGSTHF